LAERLGLLCCRPTGRGGTRLRRRAPPGRGAAAPPRRRPAAAALPALVRRRAAAAAAPVTPALPVTLRAGDAEG
jgi:hypothetical protein